MGRLSKLKWQLLIMAGLGTVILMYAADIIFVWFYAQFKNPGQEPEFYTQFAYDTAAPFIFCVAPLLMYIISRWLCERGGQLFYIYALCYFLLYFLIDMSLVMFNLEVLLSFITLEGLLIVSSKALGVFAGAFFASRAHKSNIHTE